MRFSCRNRSDIFEKIFKTYNTIVFYFCSIIFLKIGLTVAVLACLEYLFKDISLLIILAKWQSTTLADILANFAEILCGPLALFTFSDLIILLMSLVLAYGRSNLFSGTHKFLIFRMLGWLLLYRNNFLNCHFILRCIWRIS